MVVGAIQKPGISDARYELLTGGPSGRTELYLARRELNYSVSEWRQLPWWQRKMYIEGFELSGVVGRGGDSEPKGSDPQLASSSEIPTLEGHEFTTQVIQLPSRE